MELRIFIDKKWITLICSFNLQNDIDQQEISSDSQCWVLFGSRYGLRLLQFVITWDQEFEHWNEALLQSIFLHVLSLILFCIFASRWLLGGTSTGTQTRCTMRIRPCYKAGEGLQNARMLITYNVRRWNSTSHSPQCPVSSGNPVSFGRGFFHHRAVVRWSIWSFSFWWLWNIWSSID